MEKSSFSSGFPTAFLQEAAQIPCSSFISMNSSELTPFTSSSCQRTWQKGTFSALHSFLLCRVRSNPSCINPSSSYPTNLQKMFRADIEQLNCQNQNCLNYALCKKPPKNQTKKKSPVLFLLSKLNLLFCCINPSLLVIERKRMTCFLLVKS